MESKEPVTTVGIVLKTFPYSEADLVIHLLTPSHGKVSVLARGAKKSRKRFSSCPDIFDRGSFTFQRGRGSIACLTDYTPKDSLKKIREDIFKISAASLSCECFELLVKEGIEDPEPFYELLRNGMESIDSAPDDRSTVRACFDLLKALLEVAGFAPPNTIAQPGLRALAEVTTSIEQLVERELKSKKILFDLIQTLRAR